jgi:low affinity Fe/Cu permease
MKAAGARAAVERHAEAEQARQAPGEHRPRAVTSRDVMGEGILDRIADVVNQLIGSMYRFVGISVGIVAWLFAGNIVGFDKTPWPLLLTILNLPQLSIMISLQVSANRAQAASDARALADHATLVALHELAKRQVKILDAQNEVLDGQNRVLDILQRAVVKGDPSGT